MALLVHSDSNSVQLTRHMHHKKPVRQLACDRVVGHAHVFWINNAHKAHNSTASSRTVTGIAGAKYEFQITHAAPVHVKHKLHVCRTQANGVLW